MARKLLSSAAKPKRVYPAEKVASAPATRKWNISRRVMGVARIIGFPPWAVPVVIGESLRLPRRRYKARGAASAELGIDRDSERLVQLDGQGRSGGQFHVLTFCAGGDARADRRSDDGAHRGILLAFAQHLAQERAAGGAPSDGSGGLLPGRFPDAGHACGHRGAEPVRSHDPVE